MKKALECNDFKIHYQPLKFRNGPGPREGLMVSALDPKGERRPIVLLYRHACGDVVLQSRDVALKIKTLRNFLLPIMDQYDEMLKTAKTVVKVHKRKARK